MLASRAGKVNNMGKGNRSRQDRALETVQNTQEATPKSTKIKTIIATSAIAFLIIGCILLSVIANTGIVLRSRSAAKTDNFNVSGTVMSYLIYSQAQSYAYYYQQMGLTNYTISDIIKNFGVSTAVLSQVKQMLVLCEYAKANGIELTDEDKESIDASLTSIKEAAASNFYSTSAYIKMMYGNGVNLNDIRKALEMSYLSNAAYEVIEEKLEGDITDELITKYVEENVASFYTVDYLTYTFTASLGAAGAEATEDEKKAYEEEKKAMQALAAKLEEAKTADEFNDLVIDYIVNTTMSELFDETFEEDYKEDLEKESLLPDASKLEADKAEILKKVAEDLKAIYVAETTDEESEEEEEEDEKPDNKKDAYEKALDKILEELIKTAEKDYDKVIEMEHAHYDPEAEDSKISELDKWLFNKETKAGATKLLKSEGDSKSTYTVSILMKESHLDESETRDVAHILVSFDDYKTGKTITDEEKAKAKAEAQKILDEFLAGEKTQEAFEKLGEEKTADSNVVYENVYEGQMVDAFEDWCFDEARKNGDTGIVETEYGFHIMFFIGEGDIMWRANAEDGVLSDLFTEWLDAEALKCNYSYKQSVVDSIR